MPVLFKNVSIFDGSGAASYPGEVLVEGQRITAVAKGSGNIDANGAEVIDGQGSTLMPGMCEAHAHITYPNMATLDELAAVPPEEHIFVCMHNAHKMLDAGDLIGAEGYLFRTRTGEVTVRVESFELLAKSLRPLPLGKEEVDATSGARVVHSGFADVEQRYRQRYADLALHPEVREVFRQRARRSESPGSG